MKQVSLQIKKKKTFNNKKKILIKLLSTLNLIKLFVNENDLINVQKDLLT